MFILLLTSLLSRLNYQQALAGLPPNISLICPLISISIASTLLKAPFDIAWTLAITFRQIRLFLALYSSFLNSSPGNLLKTVLSYITAWLKPCCGISYSFWFWPVVLGLAPWNVLSITIFWSVQSQLLPQRGLTWPHLMKSHHTILLCL